MCLHTREFEPLFVRLLGGLAQCRVRLACVDLEKVGLKRAGQHRQGPDRMLVRVHLRGESPGVSEKLRIPA